MTRCNDCNSVITKTDSKCYICGEPVPGFKKGSRLKKKDQKVAAPITPLSNLLFMASLLVTVISFLSTQKMSLSLSATVSSILLLARVLLDRHTVKQQA